jgi:hypothetical protein
MADDFSTEITHMGTLTAVITVLFAEAADLPDPESVTVWGILNGHVHDNLSLHFAPIEASTEAVALWALRFGGVVQSHMDDYQGTPTLWVRADFTYQEFLGVTAFAAIPRPEGASIPRGQDSEPVTATPF